MTNLENKKGLIMDLLFAYYFISKIITTIILINKPNSYHKKIEILVVVGYMY